MRARWASMRPERCARERGVRRLSIPTGRTCFNEARAVCSGKGRVVVVDLAQAEVASMRPERCARERR